MKKKLILIFTGAFLIRLISLNQSLWLDEAITARVIRQYSFLGILKNFSPFDFHPPVYYWVMKFWTGFFGYSEISLRMPSIIFSILTGYLVYKIAKQLYGQMVGRWAAVLFLFNPLIIYYSQEARQYMMVTFLLTVSVYFFIKLILNIKYEKSKIHIKNQIFFNLFIFLSLMTFYGSIFLVISMLIYFLYLKKYKNFFISLFVIFVYFLIISPLLYQQITNAKVSLLSVTNWSFVLGKANLKNLLLVPIKFSIGRIDFYPKWVYYLVAGLWSAFICFLILNVFVKLTQNSKLKTQNYNSKFKTIYLLSFLLIFPLFLGFGVSFITPMLQYFRFLYLVPVMSLLIAFEINSSINRYIVLVGFIIFSLVYLCLPQFHREDWKGLALSLPNNSTVYMITPSSDALRYYRKDLQISDLRNIGNINNNLIYVIPYTTEIYGFDYQKRLSQIGYHLQEKRLYRELALEKWIKPNRYFSFFYTQGSQL